MTTKKTKAPATKKAAKKAARTAAEGKIVVKATDGKVAMVEVNSETDFTANNENFIAFADQVAEVVLASGEMDVSKINALPIAEGKPSIEEVRNEMVAKIGENLSVRRAEYLASDNILASYSHGGRIGVVVELKAGDESLAKDIAMHIAAANPLVISPNDVPQELVEREKEIYIAQAKESGKPMEIIEKMIAGRMKKFLDEVSLYGQAFVKDPSQKVENLLKSSGAEVVSFKRYEVGEGIEKDESDFVKEVMEQARGA